MKTILLLISIGLFVSAMLYALDNNKGEKMSTNSIYDFSAKSIDGKIVSMKDFEGKVILIVNVASECGFTPQYEGLQSLYEKYKDKGFVILGFPCNQFGLQEPGTDEEIKQFCESKYNISFPMFSKIEVNGDNTHPLYTYLKNVAPGVLASKDIKWNFTKFLVDKKGNVIERYAPATKPASIESRIDSLLKK